MRRNDPSDWLISQTKECPTIKVWWKEDVKLEIERLKAMLHDPAVTEEEKAIAESQIANYHEMSVTAARPPADWLRQMYLLAS